MERSHILLNFLVVNTMVFIVSANDGGYKTVGYGDDYPAYPWKRVDDSEWSQTEQNYPPRFNRPDMQPNNTSWTKRKSNFEEKMAKLNNFGKGLGVKVIYGRVPVPIILVSSYDQPQN